MPDVDVITGRLVDTVTGETILTYRNPIVGAEWARIRKGWVLRNASAYARRTGRRARWVAA